MDDGPLWENKERVRREIRARRRELTPGWMDATSRAVAARLLVLPEWRDAAVVGCYLAIDGEVRTAAILEQTQREGKALCVPAATDADGHYRLVHYENGMPLIRGPHGVPEPKDKRWIEFEDVDCLALPGLAFDADGRRLGHGGGHIDRLLAHAHGHAVKIGLAFDFQLRECVPGGALDVRMDIIVSEHTLIRSAPSVVSGVAP